MEPRTAREVGPIIRATKDVVGKRIANLEGEEIGEIQEIMVDVPAGQVTYAILSFGGVLGIGDKLFAVPWVSLTYDSGNDRFLMEVDKDLLKNAPGFDKNHWPDMSDPTRLSEIHTYYGYET